MNGLRRDPVRRQQNYFFVGMSLVFIVVVATGFGPSYTSMASSDNHPSWFIYFHGACMLVWLFIFLAQTGLAATGRLKFHRKLGFASVALAVVVWFNLGAIAVHRILVERPPVEDGGFDILAISLYIMVLFGWFVTWGILARKQPAVHKRLLLLAMIPLVHPAIGRIVWLPTLDIVPPHAWYVYVDTLLVPLFLYDWSTEKSIHKITWIGSGAIAGAQLLAFSAWGSPGWHRFWFDFFNFWR